MVGGLKGVGSQVEKLWQTQCHKWILPDIQAMCSLFGEDELPPIVAQCHHRSVVAEVKKLVARAGTLAGKVVHLVVAIEMDLEGFVANLMTLLELLHDVRFSHSGHQRRDHVFVRNHIIQ